MVSKFQTSFNAGPVESEVIIIDDSQESTSSGEAESSSTQVPKPEPKPKLEPKLKPVSKRITTCCQISNILKTIQNNQTKCSKGKYSANENSYFN